MPRNRLIETSRPTTITIYGISRVMQKKINAIAKNHYGIKVSELGKKLLSEVIDQHPNINIE